MSHPWHMLTIIGQDRPGITAAVTQALYEGGCNLGEATMARLGDSFAIMVHVSHEGSLEQLAELLRPVAESMNLKVNVEPVKGRLQPRPAPEVSVTLFAADRAGLVAQVTGILAAAGLNILDLRSDVAGTAEEPLYVMHLEGQALKGIAALRESLESAGLDGVEVAIEPIELLIG